MNYAFAENSFALSDNPSKHGLFLIHSRFNHSCIPNCNVPSTKGEIIASFATRDIVAGEEITFCYNTEFECSARDDRHRVLRFTCECKACLPGTLFQQLSDTGRTLIRGLQYLTFGRDLNGQRQGSESPIIIDSQLKKAAEDLVTPVSARLVYNLQLMFLLNEEELMNDFMIGRMYPGILISSTLFKIEGNARLARLAMEQKTWLEKLCVAFRLWERGDVAYYGIAVQLRMIHGRL